MTKKSFTRRRPVIATAVLAAGLTLVGGVAHAQLKSYDSSKPSFWQNPPPDWFLGDETEAQKGLAPPVGPATPTPLAELNDNLKNIKLPPGFKIEVYARASRKRGRWPGATTARSSSAPSARPTSMRSPTRAASARSRRS